MKPLESQAIKRAGAEKARIWVSTAEHIKRWEDHLKTKQLSDKRHEKFYPRDILACPADAQDSESKWRLVVPKGKSIMVRDLQTKDIVLVVLRNFLTDRLALLRAQEVVEEGAQECAGKYSYLIKNATLTVIRLSDPGKLALASFSAGTLWHPFFDWANFLLKSSYTQDDLDTFDHRTASVFALMWNLCAQEIAIRDYQCCTPSAHRAKAAVS